MGLAEYNKKRRFNETPEPKGEVAEHPGDLLFVIQKHDASHLHYDFRLELEGTLKSWAVPKGPSLNPAEKRLAMHVEDHPISYATFEGTIPEGNYGAGEVIVWDIGTYRAVDTGDRDESEKTLAAMYRKGRMDIELFGKKLHGRYSLFKMREKQWLLVKKDDEHADTIDITEQVHSVLSDRVLTRDKDAQPKSVAPKTQKMKKIKEATKETKKKNDPFPKQIKPMLATLTDAAFDHPDWLFEIKWDGYRAIAEVRKTIKLYSRNNLDFAKKYPPIVEALRDIPHEVILDGEIVAVDDQGRSQFQLLQNFGNKPVTLAFYIFDLLYIDGEDIRSLPLIERKKRLATIIPQSHSLLKYSDHVVEHGVAFFAEAEKQGIEGIMAKDMQSEYEPRRSEAWLKIKTHKRQEVVICGFTEPRGSREHFGSLVLGVYENNELVYVGHSGSGFNRDSLAMLSKKLKPLVTKTSPFADPPKTNMPVTWVKPKLVSEVKFTEWTNDNQMRHPIFIGLREDKPPTAVHREREKVAGKVVAEHDHEPNQEQAVSFTNLNKVFWPEEGYTKGEVINYYDRIANTILPYLKDRPQSMKRHPNGIEKPGFFQKNVDPEHLPSFVETKVITAESTDEDVRYLLCQNKETLLYMANLGCIEINPWNSRIQSLHKPDFMIIDLDPAGLTFDDVVKVAQVTHEVLDASCEKNYCKTSGKRGLHIVVPLGAQYKHEQIREFAKLIAILVNKRLPDITSLERSPSKRQKKIYLDYLQNTFAQTLAAPYCLRPWPGATVSTPLKWEEVKKGLDPKKFTIKTIFKRLEKYGDLWQPLLTEKVDLAASIKCLEKEVKT
jgi:bifunctional non-homologous end joining protein LigD